MLLLEVMRDEVTLLFTAHQQFYRSAVRTWGFLFRAHHIESIARTRHSLPLLVHLIIFKNLCNIYCFLLSLPAPSNVDVDIQCDEWICELTKEGVEHRVFFLTLESKSH